jgi:hypothetical protein
MNKRIRMKIQKHQAIEHETMTEAAGQLSLRELAEQTAAKAMHQVTDQAMALEARAEKLLEKVPLIGQAASHRLHDLAEKVSEKVSPDSAAV